MPGTRLGEILLASGNISPEQLAAALKRQSASEAPLGRILVELGYVNEEKIARALAEQLRIPFLELGDDFRVEPEEVRLIPEPIARRYGVVPMRRDGHGAITIVMCDPLDIEAVDAIRSLTNLEVHKAVSTRDRIVAVIDKYYRAEAHIERNLQDIVDLEVGEGEEAGDRAAVDSEQLRVLANDAPVVRFVNLLLMQAVRDRASDIHFEPGEKKVTVRFRVDGVLREVVPPPKVLYQAIVTRIKILSDMDIAERRLPMDGRFKFGVRGRVIDVRVSSVPEVHGEKLVLRILDRGSLVEGMNDIGFEPDIVTRFQRVLRAPHGIILLTGPTGSGKTTTLYSALTFLKSSEKNIQTVEDPVEYLIDGVNQMPTRPKIGLDFANALRSILRQDPDIVMVGEIRDRETAEIAIRAALTGHLVLSTLHTNDAPSAFSRLLDIGVASYLIAATLKLVIAQRLVRLLCAQCKTATVPSPDMMHFIAGAGGDGAGWQCCRAVGCPKCGHTGYFGRSAIVEFLEVTTPVRSMVLAGAGEVEFRRRVRESGMRTLFESGLEKVRRGETTIEEVLSVAAPPEED